MAGETYVHPTLLIDSYVLARGAVQPSATTGFGLPNASYYCGTFHVPEGASISVPLIGVQASGRPLLCPSGICDIGAAGGYNEVKVLSPLLLVEGNFHSKLSAEIGKASTPLGNSLVYNYQAFGVASATLIEVYLDDATARVPLGSRGAWFVKAFITSVPAGDPPGTAAAAIWEYTAVIFMTGGTPTLSPTPIQGVPTVKIGVGWATSAVNPKFNVSGTDLTFSVASIDATGAAGTSLTNYSCTLILTPIVNPSEPH